MLGPFGSPAGMPPMGGGGVFSQLFSQGGPGLAALLAQIHGQMGGTQPASTGSMFQAPLPIPAASNAGFHPFPPAIQPTGNPTPLTNPGSFNLGSGSTTPPAPLTGLQQSEQNQLLDILRHTGALPAGMQASLASGQGGGGQNGIGAAGQAGGQMGSAGQQGTFGKDAADALTGLATGGIGLLGAGTLGAMAARGMLGPSFGPASLHNADINPSAYGIDSSGYSAADFGIGSGYGAGTEGGADSGAGNGFGGGSDAGGHAGQGSAEGGEARGGIIKGKGGPREDNIPTHVSVGEAVVNNPATKAVGSRFIRKLNRIGNSPESEGAKRQQAKRLVRGKLTVR